MLRVHLPQPQESWSGVMKSERFEHIVELFEAALELDPVMRRAFLHNQATGLNQSTMVRI